MYVTKVTGIKRLYYASKYSLKGLKAAYLSEPAIRQELVLLLCGVALAAWLDVSTIERVILIGCLVFVIIVELLNSAVEAVVDRIGLDFHELSGKAKDIGSAAVFVSLMLASFCWLSIALPLFLG